MQGKIIILSGPSQVGKDVILKEILKHQDELNLEWITTYTTRPKRHDEENGINHHFVDTPTFEKMAYQNEFLEWAPVRDYAFGTPKKPVMDALQKGKNVILKIDVRGAEQIVGQFPENTYRIFIAPRNIEEIENRIRKNKEIPEEQVQIRLREAHNEIAASTSYDHVIVNPEGHLEDTKKGIIQILRELNAKNTNQE